MKKLVIVVGLLVVPLIGYCQSPGDRIVFSEAYKQTVNTKVERTVVTQTVNKQLQEQNEIQRILKIKLENYLVLQIPVELLEKVLKFL